MKTYNYLWKHRIPWKFLQILPTTYARLLRNELGNETSYLHALLKNLPNESLWSYIFEYYCHMWKLEAPKPWKGGIWVPNMWLQLSFLSLRWSSSFHTCKLSLFTWWLKITMWIEINPKKLYSWFISIWSLPRLYASWFHFLLWWLKIMILVLNILISRLDQNELIVIRSFNTNYAKRPVWSVNFETEDKSMHHFVVPTPPRVIRMLISESGK